MRITILQGAFIPLPPNGAGAVEKIWSQLANQFSKCGHEVTQISRHTEGLPYEETLQGVRHLRISGFDTPKSIIVLKFLDLIYTLRCIKHLPESDIIVTNTFWAPPLVPKRAGTTIVSVERLPKGQLRIYPKSVIFRANSSAVMNAILAENSNYKERSLIIPNPLPFDTKTLPDVSKKKQQLLYVGRIHPEKGIHLLLEAFENLRTRNPEFKDWKLDIVGPWDVASGGDSIYKQRLEKQFSDLVNITWHGAIHDIQELQSCYERASIFIYPSLAEFGETFGLAPLEAMAFGCIPIVSDLACFRDFIADGINGAIFDHRSEDNVQSLIDAILKIANADTNNMMQEATKVRATHSLESISQQFLTAFEEIIHECPAT